MSAEVAAYAKISYKMLWIGPMCGVLPLVGPGDAKDVPAMGAVRPLLLQERPDLPAGNPLPTRSGYVTILCGEEVPQLNTLAVPTDCLPGSAGGPPGAAYDVCAGLMVVTRFRHGDT